ncbi:MAG: YlbF family regulator [Coprobacillus sp.]
MKRLNKDIEEKAQALNQWILKQEVVIEYQKYEKLIKDNDFLQKEELVLKDLQKQIVKEKHLGNDCQELIQEYEIRKKSFDENPIVFNYLVLKQEVNDLISLIQDDINKQLKKKVDEIDKNLYNF